MNRKATWITLAVLLAVWAAAEWWRAKSEGRFAPRIESAPEREKTEKTRETGKTGKTGKTEKMGETQKEGETEEMGEVREADKWGAVEKIRQDYEEMGAKLGAEFAAAGKDFPGGLNAYLRQLALLAQEGRRDIAAILTPQEMEDWELKETLTGKNVQRGLTDAAVSDEQRRAVFRLQNAFDQKYGLVFDLNPAALLTRETERQQLQENILGALGPDAFVRWLENVEPEMKRTRELVEQRGLPAQLLVEVWRIKSDHVRQNLANAGANDDQRAVQHAELTEATRLRIEAVLGAGTVAAAGPAVFPWLNAKP